MFHEAIKHRGNVFIHIELCLLPLSLRNVLCSLNSIWARVCTFLFVIVFCPRGRYFRLHFEAGFARRERKGKPTRSEKVREEKVFVVKLFFCNLLHCFFMFVGCNFKMTFFVHSG